MPRDIGLYYPWIHFRDDDWVKLSLLYWKGLKRIVPPDYAKQDSAVVDEFVDAGLVSDTDAVSSRERIARTFAEIIRRDGAALRARYSIEHATDWSAEAPLRHFQVPANGTAGNAPFAFIHTDKVAHALREELRDARLGAYVDYNNQWIGVHPEVARVYMTALAEDIAHRQGLHPVTEDVVDHVAVSGWSVERLAAALLPTADLDEEARSQSDPAAALAFVAMKSVIPENLSSVAPLKIIEIREKCESELRDFRSGISDLVDIAGVASISDPTAFDESLRESYEAYIAPKLRALEESLKIMKVGTVPSLINLNIAMPPLASVGMTELGVAQPLSTGSAVLLGLTQIRGSLAARAREDMQGNPAAYLYGLKEELGPADLRNRLRRTLRRFVLDV